MNIVRAMAERFIHMHHRSRSRTKHWRWAILITPHATNDRSPTTSAPSTMVCHWLYVRGASVQMSKSGKPIATHAANDPMKAMTDDTRMIQPTYAHITSPSCGHIQPCRFAAERLRSAARDLWTFHRDRFYRESAASRGSGRWLIWHRRAIYPRPISTRGNALPTIAECPPLGAAPSQDERRVDSLAVHESCGSLQAARRRHRFLEPGLGTPAA
jgi:hypothetical protein